MALRTPPRQGMAVDPKLPEVVTPILRRIAVEHFLPIAIGQARVADDVAVGETVVVEAGQD